HAPPRRAARQRGVPARQRAAGVTTAELTDDTLGGYWRVHERAPAFGGADGRPYSVGTFVDETPDAQGRYGAALLFVQWSDAGDVVELEVRADRTATISRVRPRRSVLARRAAAGDRVGRRAQPIAANVDQVVVVAATRDPEPNPRMLDRFLVIAEANRLPAVIVLNKVDLDGAALEPLVGRYAPAGHQVLAASVTEAVGLAALRDLLRGRESVLAGQSGVGKSSLLNAIQPGLDLPRR